MKWKIEKIKTPIEYYNFRLSTLKDIAQCLHEIFKEDETKNKFVILVLCGDGSQKLTEDIDEFDSLGKLDMKSFWVNLVVPSVDGLIDVRINESSIFPSGSSIEISSNSFDWTAAKLSKLNEIIKASKSNSKKYLYQSPLIVNIQVAICFIVTAIISYYLLEIAKKILSISSDFYSIFYVLSLVVVNSIIMQGFLIPVGLFLKNLLPNVEIISDKSKYEKSTLKGILFPIFWGLVVPLAIMALSIYLNKIIK